MKRALRKRLFKSHNEEGAWRYGEKVWEKAVTVRDLGDTIVSMVSKRGGRWLFWTWISPRGITFHYKKREVEA